MATILVVAEIRDGVPTGLTREVLGLARELAGEGVAALAFTPHPEPLADLIAHGAGRVYWCDQSEAYDGELWVAVTEQVAQEIAPEAILACHTSAGAELAPRLAFRLQSAVATGCTGITSESGKLLFTRGCYGGNVRETMSFATIPAIATVKAGVGVPNASAVRTGDIVRVTAPALIRRTRIVARQRESADTQALENAKIIVAGGRGLEGPEGFRVLEALAQSLGAAVGSSRVPCDLGWCPHSWQIGLTGKTVTPDLYFAIGISGAGQHMAGCGNAKTIVAINTDADAAIFREARYGIVGDYRKVVPALVDAVKALDSAPGALPYQPDRT
jgi:electron transfer flavoprotein alpha subunit